MKKLQYQQDAVADLVGKTVRLLDFGGHRRKIVFEAPTGAGKTVMACRALAGIVDELGNRGSSRFRECAFIWFAPRKLHLQSYASLKRLFRDTRKLHPVMFDELDRIEGIRPGEILFVNWESVNKDNNAMVRGGESCVSLYEIARRTREEAGLPIVAVIDEEHMFWSKTADKSGAVLDRIDPAVEIRISATPKTSHPDELVRIYRQEVVAAEMIKREVVLNPEIESDFDRERSLDEHLIGKALERRDRLAEAYRSLGVGINPLLLIQLPNDGRESMTSEDSAIAGRVRSVLRQMHGITVENGLLAVWLANEKSNLEGLERPDGMARVLLFKEAIALGWDCPRASVLLIFRNLASDQFTVQTVGRILRMPEQKHYPLETLNVGYVYTDIAREKIRVVVTDADYILGHALVARRREGLHNVRLSSRYEERPNADRNYLGPDFRRVLYGVAAESWNLEGGADLFGPVADPGADEASPAGAEAVAENRRRVRDVIDLDVDNINVRIPKDVHFQNDVQTITAKRAGFARTASEIDRVFIDYIDAKGNQFERKGRTDKIAGYLIEMISDFFGIAATEAKKVVLQHENRRRFDLLLDRALETYARRRRSKRELSARRFKAYDWCVPEERIYDDAANRIVAVGNHALSPFVQLARASSPECRFIEFLEEHSEWIDWWYKNGDRGKQHFAVEYRRPDGTGALFYVDFVIRMKNGHVYLFDTKSADSDRDCVCEKHNALVEYIRSENARPERAGSPLGGGIIVQSGANWIYPEGPVENIADTLGWSGFYPRNA